MPETQILSINPDQIDPEIMATAARCLKAGGLVAFPTETVYGLGANALAGEAVQKIFIAKGRPFSDPLIVHIAQLEQLTELVREVPEKAHQLVEKFWPGPLTLVLKKQPIIPDNVTAGLDTVAVRMPAHPVAHELIKQAAVPVAAPSANRFSRPSATTAQHVYLDLQGQADVILDGGPAAIGLESTVLDITGDLPLVLRPGGIPLETLREFIPDIQLKADYLSEENAAPAPGMMTKHYSPRATVYFLVGNADNFHGRIKTMIAELVEKGQKVGVLLPEEAATDFAGQPVEIIYPGSATDFARIGYNLFAALRELDERGVDVILAHEFGQQGLGLTIRDRLMRAAEGQVIYID